MTKKQSNDLTLKIELLTELDKKEIKRLTKISIDFTNTLFDKHTLSVDGRETMIEYTILYGFEEVMKCLTIVANNYSNVEDDILFDKFKGIIYNRNEKKLLVKK